MEAQGTMVVVLWFGHRQGGGSVVAMILLLSNWVLYPQGNNTSSMSGMEGDGPDDPEGDLSMEKLEAEAREVQNNKVSNNTSHSHSVASPTDKKAQSNKANTKYRQDWPV